MSRSILLLVLVLALPSQAQTYRVNCGGGSYNDPFGRSWSGDRAYSAAAGYGAIGGYSATPYPSYIYQGGTDMETLYWTGRYNHSEYRFDVANGTYTLTLRFGERERHGPGLRVQSISAEGVALIQRLDIARDVGKDYSLDHAYRVDVNDGQLNVVFSPILGQSLVSAISVVPTPPDTVGPPPPPSWARGIFDGNLVYWNQGTAPDLAGYRVMRGPSFAGPFVTVSEPVVRLRRFIDRSPPPGESWYMVLGVDVFGNVGPLTAAKRATPLDDGDSNVRIFDLDLDPLDLKFLDSNPQTDTYVPATFSYEQFDADIASTRYRGNIGRRYSKKSFNIRVFGVPFEGRDKIALKAAFGDQTIFRERLCYDLHRMVNVPTPESGLVHLHVNGRHRGVFLESETHGEVFLDHHRMDENGDLYKTNWGADLFPEAGLSQYMSLYEKKTNQEQGWGLLIDLVDTLTTAPPASMAVELARRIDIQRWLDYYALTVLVADTDSTYHNYWLYRNSTSGLFTMLPWDRDISMYNSNLPIDAGTVSAGSTIGGPNQLITRVMEVPLFRTIYVEKLQEILASVYTLTNIQAILATAFADLMVDGRADVWKREWEENGPFDNGPLSLSNIASSRINYISSRIPGFTTPIPRAVLINELQARNQSTLADGAGDFDDWIELHNRSGSPVDVSGWHLSDDAALPAMWTLPAGSVIPPGGHLLVWADNEPLEGPLHATFTLDGDGDKVFLFGPTAAGNPLVDLVALDVERIDHSYGRRQDGGALWYELVIPTPGAANSGVLDLAPTIWGESLDPCIPGAGEDIVLRVMTEDDGGDTQLVEVEVDQGLGPQLLPMADDGLPPDHYASDDEWVVTLPPAPAATIVHYFVRAADGAGHAITEPERAPVRRLAYGIPASTGSVLINEVCANNESIISDPAGDFDDWVELHNTTTLPLDVSSMFLTDDLDDTTKWAIPLGTVIPPQGFLLIWVDAEPGEGPLHATFKLSSRGESVALFDTFALGNGLLDVLTFCRQAPDTSVGRTWDAGPHHEVLVPPTPGASNGAPPPPPVCPATSCGDCDLDGDIDILDSLAAALHAAAVAPLTGAGLANCDVDSISTTQPPIVTVLDSLLVAQWAAGLSVMLECCP